MTQSKELIYTSAPSGLRTGSKGFCTVAMTVGMPAGLVGPLENLSAYRHIDGEVPPVNFSHVRMKVAGRNVTVLSRIGKTDADYTGRTNKLAHHIVVDSGDRVAAGPAAVLGSPGFLTSAWDGKVAEIPSPKTIPSPTGNQQVATQWEAVTGDAGWAGHVASKVISDGPPIWVIHSPEQNPQLLKMIDETLSILPPSRRWEVTFSTYCGEIPPGVTCRLRFVLAGTPEAAAAKNDTGTIDLSGGPLGPPLASDAAQAARDGVIWDPTPSAQPQSGASNVNAPTSEADTLSDTSRSMPPSAYPDPEFPLPADLPAAGAPPPRLDQQPAADRHRNVLILVAIATAMLLLLGGAGFYYATQGGSDGLLDQLNAVAGIKETQSQKPKRAQPEHAEQDDVDVAIMHQPDTDAIVPGSEPSMDQELVKEQRKRDDNLKNAKRLMSKIINDAALLDERKELNERSANMIVILDQAEKAVNQKIPQLANIDLLEDQRTAKELAEQIYNPITESLNQQKEKLLTVSERSIPWDKDKKNNDLKLAKWIKSFQRWQQLDNSIKLGADPKEKIESLDFDRASQRARDAPGGLFSMEALKQLQSKIKEKQIALQKEQEELRKRITKLRDRHTLRIYFDTNFIRQSSRLTVRLRCPLPWINVQSADNFIVGRDSIKQPEKVPTEGKNALLPKEGIYLVRTGKIFQIELPRSQSFPQASLFPAIELIDAAIVMEKATKSYLETGKKIQNKKSEASTHQPAMKAHVASLKKELPDEESKEIDSKVTALKNAWKKLQTDLNTKSNSGSDREKLDAMFAQPTEGLKDLITKMSNFSETGGLSKTEEKDETPAHTKFKNWFIDTLDECRDLQGHRKNLNEAYRNIATAKQFNLNNQIIFQRSDSTTAIGQSTFETVGEFDLYLIPRLVDGPDPNTK